MFRSEASDDCVWPRPVVNLETTIYPLPRPKRTASGCNDDYSSDLKDE